MYRSALLLSKDSVALIDAAHNVHLVKHIQNTTQAVLTSKYLVTGGSDKTVRVWTLGTWALHYSMSLPKKIKRIVVLSDDILVSDKHGDIFDITQAEMEAGSQVTVKSTIKNN